MTAEQWRRCVGLVLALWPGDNWPELTVEAGWLLCSELDADPVRQAIAQIAREGSRFAPPPGEVYQRAAEFTEPPIPLADPEALRDPTPEELERARRWLPNLHEQIRQLSERKALPLGWPDT